MNCRKKKEERRGKKNLTKKRERKKWKHQGLHATEVKNNNNKKQKTKTHTVITAIDHFYTTLFCGFTIDHFYITLFCGPAIDHFYITLDHFYNTALYNSLQLQERKKCKFSKR